MPVHEYVCLDCGKEFTIVLSVQEHERGHATCPRCQSKEVEQQPSTGDVVTSRKS
jgi:putative FmdB family regulatory protein